MDKVKIYIGDLSYNCQVAKNEEDRRKGLMNVDYLPKDEGMLFEWKEEGRREMWMKDTKIPLDQIGINEDGEVTMIHQGIPESEDLVPFPNAKWVLEVNADSGIKVGDDFEIDEDLNKYVMKVLAPDGTTQMLLQGGERIISRRETLILIKKAKRAQEHKDSEKDFDRYCKSLGKYMFKVLKGQNERPAQYVDGPELKKSDTLE